MKKRPKCAHCGGVLSGPGLVVVENGRLPGAPSVGWHVLEGETEDCFTKDPLARDVVKVRLAEEIAIAIGKRGDGRVRAKKEWFEHVARRAA